MKTMKLVLIALVAIIVGNQSLVAMRSSVNGKRTKVNNMFVAKTWDDCYAYPSENLVTLIENFSQKELENTLKKASKVELGSSMNRYSVPPMYQAVACLNAGAVQSLAAYGQPMLDQTGRKDLIVALEQCGPNARSINKNPSLPLGDRMCSMVAFLVSRGANLRLTFNPYKRIFGRDFFAQDFKGKTDDYFASKVDDRVVSLGNFLSTAQSKRFGTALQRGLIEGLRAKEVAIMAKDARTTKTTLDAITGNLMPYLVRDVAALTAGYRSFLSAEEDQLIVDATRTINSKQS